MPILYAALAIGAASSFMFKILASGVEDAGQAINQTGSGVLKIAIAAGGSYFLLKKTKVI